jgi:hypothetical protein
MADLVADLIADLDPDPGAKALRKAAIEDAIRAAIETEDLDLGQDLGTTTILNDAQTPESDASFVRNAAIQLETALLLKSYESFASCSRIKASPKTLISPLDLLVSPTWIRMMILAILVILYRKPAKLTA